jgi:hypothetical protein
MTEENWNSWYTALLWIIPAKVEGAWKLPQGELIFQQEFQIVYGTFKSGNKNSTINDGRLNGDTFTFSVDGEAYTGHVYEKTIEGTITTGSTKKDWFATRAE